jgi:hypothetical protein
MKMVVETLEIQNLVIDTGTLKQNGGYQTE